MWNSIYGQDSAKSVLRKMVKDKRLPGALLFQGSVGTGAVGLAVEMARYANCSMVSAGEEADEACGECRSCVQFRNLQHPNLSIVVALPPGKYDGPEDLKSDVIDQLNTMREALARSPYSVTTIPNATQIRIWQIREARRQLSLSASQDGHRFLVIPEAQQLTTEASNAFLKSLEEPHPGITIILVAANSEQLLPTILSRCVVVRVPPLPDSQVSAALIEIQNMDRGQAALAASFAQGDITVGLNLGSDSFQDIRHLVLDALRASVRSKDWRMQMAQVAQAVSDTRDRIQMSAFLNLIILFLRDAFRLRYHSPEAGIVNEDERETVERFAASFGNADLGSAITVVEAAHINLIRNPNPVLLIVSTLISLRRILLAGNRLVGR